MSINFTRPIDPTLTVLVQRATQPVGAVEVYTALLNRSDWPLLPPVAPKSLSGVAVFFRHGQLLSKAIMLVGCG